MLRTFGNNDINNDIEDIVLKEKKIKTKDQNNDTINSKEFDEFDLISSKGLLNSKNQM